MICGSGCLCGSSPASTCALRFPCETSTMGRALHPQVRMCRACGQRGMCYGGKMDPESSNEAEWRRITWICVGCIERDEQAALAAVAAKRHIR